MFYKDNWCETQQRFIAWWNGDKLDRPLIRIIGRRDAPIGKLEPEKMPENPEQQYLDPDNAVVSIDNFCKTHAFMADSFPNLSLNLGPGSMALYLGSDPVFSRDTIWFKECITDWTGWGPLQYNPQNHWWQLHLKMLNKARQLAGDRFLINIPDIVENVDILSAMRGPQNFCYDLIDEPELIKDYIHQVDDLYFQYYDPVYEIVKGNDGSCSYTAFEIWGPGKTAKLQCDFSALMSPVQFREFIQPSLQKQCQILDFTLYHLDGPGAIKHLDAIMEIPELNALQWTPGAGQADGGDEKWYPIYDKVRTAGKSLWISFDRDLGDCITAAAKLIKRYGNRGMYFHFPETEVTAVENLLLKAEREWR